MQYLVNVIMTYTVRLFNDRNFETKHCLILLIIQKNILIFVVLSYHFDYVSCAVHEVQPSLKGDENSGVLVKVNFIIFCNDQQDELVKGECLTLSSSAYCFLNTNTHFHSYIQ